MKKLVLSLAVLFGVAMVSCGGDKKDANNESGTDITLTETETVVEDSAAPADTTAPKAEGEVKEEAPKADAPAADKAEKDAPKEDSAK